MRLRSHCLRASLWSRRWNCDRRPRDGDRSSNRADGFFVAHNYVDDIPISACAGR